MQQYLNKIMNIQNKVIALWIMGVVVFIIFPIVAYAEVVVPDSGTIIKQLSPEPFNSTNKNDQQYFDSNTAQQNYSLDQTPIWVSEIQIVGNKIIDEITLHNLVKNLENKNNKLADLQHGVDIITQYYKNKGYFLAKAYLPRQRLDNGVLEIKILEGKLDKVVLNNQSKIKNSVIEKYTNQIPRNQALQQEQSNKTILLISDLSGIGQIQANLQAGDQFGDTDLYLDIADQKQWLGRLGVDNAGSTYTGKYRFMGYLEGDSILGFGEKLSLQVLSSNQDLISGSLNTQFPISGNGLLIGGGMSKTDYELGGPYTLLEAKGRSENYNLNLTYPFMRSQQMNLNLKLLLEKRKLFDEIEATETETIKSTKVSRIALNFSRIDDWGIGNLKGGANQIEFINSIGNLDIQSKSALNIDRLSAKTQGSFNKSELKFSRQQRLSQLSWLTGELYGQLSSKNLDSSEKFSFNQMRAYPSAEGLGDQGWGASMNVYYQLHPNINVYIFKDLGEIQQNKHTYLVEKNTRYLGSAGIGLQGAYQNFDYNTTIAWRDSSAAKSDKDQKPRILFQAGWRF